MSVLDYIIEGIEAELTLERELGVRSIELSAPLEPIDISEPLKQLSPVERLKSVEPSESAEPSKPVATSKPVETSKAVEAVRSSTEYDFVFLHHQPLSADAETMMAKIIEGMHKTRETAPIVCELPVPKAKVYVILGSHALKKFQPNLKAAPGQRLRTEKGAEVLVTYSPEYILRFKTVTPAVRKMKGEMWIPLRALGERFKGG